MTHTPLHILRMSRAELHLALDWAAREGWNPGRQDADIFHSIDVRGHFMAWQGEEPVACISGLRYGVSYGFIGLYIVQPEWRGRGLGMAVWNAALDHLKGCVVGLDGVVEQQHNYRRSGFDLAWHNRRYQTMGHAPRPRGPHVVKLTSVPFELLASYDRAFHPEARPVFLQAWIQQRQGMALGWLEDGRLRGYGVVRACAEGHKIGPLCADTPAIADALLDALLGCVMLKEPVFLDIPEPNREAIALAERLGMTPGFPTARMYRGPAPRLDLARQYALTALEVG
ncbi:MAG: GNAT family N-acetyltransferase [Hydrogenophaga sp.]|uniref:GNAT family N-acetyltransferase n=1 Tax=Hydrogenophaga sp. TaxID=1904254 RepID=UPI001D432ECF|nr:GNAT family N-acetyltransferase [Hydrogenophaga sp.]MBX3609258.1 GNAT family N-acetyltransferase [Hydrogenophaga sp.]